MSFEYEPFPKVIVETLAILPKVTGLLSMTGSAFILRDLLRKRRHADGGLHPISWVILNLSAADLISSFLGGFMSTWLIPNDTPEGYAAFAAGTDVTCDVQAFIFDSSFLCSMLSNGLLAITYWLQICKKWDEQQLMKLRWTFLIFPWIIGIAWSTVHQVLHGAAYNGLWSCTYNTGNNTTTFISDGVQFIIFFGVFTMILFSMVSLVRTVYQQERRMDVYRTDCEERSRSRTKQTAYQGIWYIGTFLLVQMPLVIATAARNKVPNWFWIINAIFIPVQGLLTAIVYFRHRFIAKTMEHHSTVMALSEVLEVSVPSLVDVRSTILLGVDRANSSISMRDIFLRRSTMTHKNSDTEDGPDDNLENI